MKLLIIALLLVGTHAWADNIITWEDANNGQTETLIEAMSTTGFVEIARVPKGVTTYTHVGVDIGCYKARSSFIDSSGAESFSVYTPIACKVGAPANFSVQ